MSFLKLTFSSLPILILSYGISYAENVEMFGVARSACVGGGGATSSSLCCLFIYTYNC